MLAELAREAGSMGRELEARLFDNIAGLLELCEKLQEENEELIEHKKKTENHAEYVEFFNDCFERLAHRYTCPSVTNEYDKSVIFSAIENGEAVGVRE